MLVVVIGRLADPARHRGNALKGNRQREQQYQRETHGPILNPGVLVQMDYGAEARGFKTGTNDAVVLRGSYHNVVPLRAASKVERPAQIQESLLDAARRRYGKPFAHEQGSRFVWAGGPTVLNRWLAERTLRRAA